MHQGGLSAVWGPEGFTVLPPLLPLPSQLVSHERETFPSCFGGPQRKKEGKNKTILFNLCGHGYLDLQAYQDFFENKLVDHTLPSEEIHQSIEQIRSLQP